nr:immunoglobulin light chain junction region [Macaca mulatta]MPN89166.1 immunoglobulin light chain junction region [Macaca mulatta]
CRQGIQFPLTF